MLNRQFLLHLSLIEGVGPHIIQKIIQANRSDLSASDLYGFSATDWQHQYGITPGAAQKIAEGLSNKKMLEDEIFLLAKHAINCVTIFDDAYPTLLKEIYLPPAVLYYKGVGFSENQKHIAVVGSRAANAYGHTIVSTIIPQLVAADAVIVSGGALGIDTYAHDYAVKNGGKTIAVLGSGLLREYPPSNKKLFASIVEKGGLMMSAFPLRMEALPGHFPARNRIISGLSHGCLVVQAAQKSGALITARYAVEQGRDVFAVPGSITDLLSVGCHELIQQGAKLVISANDILQEIDTNFIPTKQDVQQMVHTAQAMQMVIQPAQHDKYADLPEMQRTIIKLCKQSISLDDIVQQTGFDVAVVQSELFDMQCERLIEQDFTGNWQEISSF